jgi:hypothetical protein
MAFTKEKVKEPLKTKTGKIRLGPLNMTQLGELLEKSNKDKEKAKIRNRMRILTSRIKTPVAA